MCSLVERSFLFDSILSVVYKKNTSVCYYLAVLPASSLILTDLNGHTTKYSEFSENIHATSTK